MRFREDGTKDYHAETWKRAQTTMFRHWENHCRIPNISYGADVLGLSWISYKRYRTGHTRLSLSMRLAMSAIAHQLEPWGGE